MKLKKKIKKKRFFNTFIYRYYIICMLKNTKYVSFVCWWLCDDKKSASLIE